MALFTGFLLASKLQHYATCSMDLLDQMQSKICLSLSVLPNFSKQ